MIPGCSRRRKRPSIRITGKRGLWSMHWQFWVSVIAQNRKPGRLPFHKTSGLPRALKRHIFPLSSTHLMVFGVFAFVPKVMRLGPGMRAILASSSYRQDRFAFHAHPDRDSTKWIALLRRCHVLSLCTARRVPHSEAALYLHGFLPDNIEQFRALTSWRDNRTFPFEAITARNAAASRIGIDRFLCQADALRAYSHVRQ